MKQSDSISLFLVDDNPVFQKSLEHYLQHRLKHSIQIRSFSNGEDCLKHLSEKPDIVVLDYLLDSADAEALNGLDVLDKIKQQSPELTVILLSGQEKMEVATDSIRHGAYDYVIKNENAFGRIQNLIRNAAAAVSLRRQVSRYRVWGLACIFIFACLLSTAVVIAYFFPEWVHTF